MVTQSFVRRPLDDKYKIKVAGKKTTYLLNLDTLREIDAKRWSRQRPADDTRVEEIRTWIEKENDVAGMLAMAWHPVENLIVYDGQHRWRALLGLANPNIRVFVEILWDATEEDIIASFQSINRSVSVPELYTDPGITTDSVRADIADFVSSMCSNHKEFMSTTDKPNRPHFNRDKLTDELFGIWRDDLQREVDFTKIAGALMVLNHEYDSNQMSVPREAVRKHPRIYEKCHKHHLWLFAQTGHINKEHLRAILDTM